MHKTLENPYPTKEQELLLKAALMQQDNSIIAFEEWKKLVDIEGYLDHGSFRLLPLLYKNLLKNSVNGDFMNRLKGVYNQSFDKNNELFYETAKVLQFFHDRKIRTLLLKGAALTLMAYKDHGVRPMADIDLLVPFSQASDTIDLLKNDGWKAENDQYIEYNLCYGRSIMFSNQEGFELDLHWHPFFESHRNSSDTDFWDHAVPIKISEISTLAFCPEDMLLHVNVHGMKWNIEPPIRWIADAISLINSSGDQFDWRYLLDQVKKYKVNLQVKFALIYLKNKFNAAIPDFVTDQLKNAHITCSERLVFKDSQRNSEKEPDRFFPKLFHLLLIYLQQSNEVGLIKQIIGFIKYLRFRTAMKGPLHIVWRYIPKIRKK